MQVQIVDGGSMFFNCFGKVIETREGQSRIEITSGLKSDLGKRMWFRNFKLKEM